MTPLMKLGNLLSKKCIAIRFLKIGLSLLYKSLPPKPESESWTRIHKTENRLELNPDSMNMNPSHPCFPRYLRCS
jgi:hypothetical protein